MSGPTNGTHGFSPVNQHDSVSANQNRNKTSQSHVSGEVGGYYTGVESSNSMAISNSLDALGPSAGEVGYTIGESSSEIAGGISAGAEVVGNAIGESTSEIAGGITTGAEAVGGAANYVVEGLEPVAEAGSSLCDGFCQCLGSVIRLDCCDDFDGSSCEGGSGGGGCGFDCDD